MSDKYTDQHAEADEREPEDLDVPAEQSEDIKGGKVSMQDFHFTRRVDKSSPK